ncbi:MAG: phosphate ABC transporter substrate-binding protein PstS [Acidobacteriota bacterium]|nr:phosphate ABC transporter substrate-binding protein PstS [Acidobacteriota bacterium]
MKKNVLILLAGLALACGGGESRQPVSASTPDGGGTLAINGAGATFPYPLYSKWFADFGAKRPEVRINYQSIGSGGGIRQLSAGTVFFGATDSPMTDEQLKAAGGNVLHFPTTLGAVVPVYNVPNVAALNFPRAVLADIFLGKVAKWNDARLAAANAGVQLPDLPIVVVHRSDGSGTTFIFCDFLSKVSPAFKSTIGASTSVQWPAGVGAKGNEGVAGLVRQTPGAIGYVELVYALQNNIAYGAVENSTGKFVRASTESVTAAAAGATIPPDFRVSITNAPGETAYPIASFTWLLLRERSTDTRRAAAMADFLRWALTDGQQECARLGYAPLPANVIQSELPLLDRVK